MTRWLLFGLSQVALAAQRHQQGKHLMAGKSPASASPWPSDCPTRLAGCVSLFLWTPKKKLSSELAVFLRLIPSFHHQDSVKSEILWSAQDETEGKKPAQDVFPGKSPGEPGLAVHICWRCGVQSKPFELVFWNLQKDPAHQRGSDPPRCAWQALLSILHESTTF